MATIPHHWQRKALILLGAFQKDSLVSWRELKELLYASAHTIKQLGADLVVFDEVVN